MILISHRGNIDGKKPHLENQPDYIDEAIALGYDVEIDVWLIDGVLFLGHDAPQYEISDVWLEKDMKKYGYIVKTLKHWNCLMHFVVIIIFGMKKIR